MSLTRIPASQVPVLESNGLMSREWYRFFYNLFELTGGGSSQITPAELQAEIDVLDTSVNQLTTNVNSLDNQVNTIDESVSVLSNQFNASEQQANLLYYAPPDNAGEIEKALTDAKLAQLECCLDNLSSMAQGLNLQPPVLNTGDLAIGAFYDTTTQVPVAANTAYAVTFNAVTIEKGVYRGSTTSRIYVTNPGWFNFQFSAQLDATSGGDHEIYIWARINGTDVANSASQVRIRGNNGETIAAWNFFLQLAAGDYFELVYSASDTDVQILAQAASSPVPAIPSVILTVNQIYSPYGH